MKNAPMTNIMDKWERALLNRVEIAKRWYGIKDVDYLVRFALDDPDVRAIGDTPEFDKTLRTEKAEKIVDDVLRGFNIDLHRQTAGDQVVDLILAWRDEQRGA